MRTMSEADESFPGQCRLGAEPLQIHFDDPFMPAILATCPLGFGEVENASSSLFVGSGRSQLFR